MKSSELSVWLSDLTYTQQSILAETMPMAIGCIATYTESNIEFDSPIRLFKYPEKLAEALDMGLFPDVIGFSNYMWNTELSSSFARLVKRHSPDTVVVFGGPHYPLEPSDQERFLKDRPEIDFYIVKEGEAAFCNLISELMLADSNIEDVKNQNLLSVHAISSTGVAILPPVEKRLVQLDEIPSPYTSGRLDEFFDGHLVPLLQTNRGCPFSCTFCVEGVDYYSKVRRYSIERVTADVSYIGQHMDQIKKLRMRNDLFIADSNFGMYSSDKDACYALKDTRTKYGWPEYISVSTGKNKKERVLEAAEIVEGAIKLSGSVQSLDKEVLANINRKNISSDQLIDLGLSAKKLGVNSHSELILGLPGESKSTHLSTIKQVMDAGFNYIVPYQLMLLPGSELETKSTREKYEFCTKYRVLAKAFGKYQSLGEEIVVAEIEEICVGSNTLSYDDYMYCRKFHLFLVIFYNDGVFHILSKLLAEIGVSHFRWIESMMELALPPTLSQLFDDFLRDTEEELWENKQDLAEFTREPGVIQRYIDGELGNNLLFGYRTKAVTQYVDDLKIVAKEALDLLLDEAGRTDSKVIRFIEDALTYHAMRLSNIFENRGVVPECDLEYDLVKYERDETPTEFEKYRYSEPKRFMFVMDRNQEDLINRYLGTFGSSTTGIARIISRTFVKNLYRQPIQM